MEKVTLTKALELLEGDAGRETLTELQELAALLKEFGVEQYVSFDLTLVSHMSYYTGMLFEVYAGQVGSPIGSGGRYDNLLEEIWLGCFSNWICCSNGSTCPSTW